MSNKKGFTLIETLFAVLIVGISVISLLRFQGVLIRLVFGSHNLVERLAHIKNYFVIADKDKLFEKGQDSKKIEDPDTRLTYTAKKPTGKMASFENILIENVQANWPGLIRENQETFVSFRFQLPKKAPAPGSKT